MEDYRNIYRDHWNKDRDLFTNRNPVAITIAIILPTEILWRLLSRSFLKQIVQLSRMVIMCSVLCGIQQKAWVFSLSRQKIDIDTVSIEHCITGETLTLSPQLARFPILMWQQKYFIYKNETSYFLFSVKVGSFWEQWTKFFCLTKCTY